MLLQLVDGPKWGRDLGSNYVMLARMEDDGLLVGLDVGEHGRIYAITESGHAALAANKLGYCFVVVVQLSSFAIWSFLFTISTGWFRALATCAVVLSALLCVRKT